MNFYPLDRYTNILNDPNLHLYLVVYDISGNRKRYRISKFLSRYGFRIQRSAFEIIGNHAQETEILTYLMSVVSDKDDLVRMYRLCGNDKVASFGNIGKAFDEEVVIL